MKIEQIYTGCLAQGAYYITSGKEAVIIDPLREIQPYIERAQKDGVSIKYVFETHFHADFVSGHIDLAKATGATIVYGPTAQPAFDAHVAKDEEIFAVGDVVFQVLHTPGHTMESCCYLLKDTTGKDVALFSGDTLFLGDVGRPDLAQKAANMTMEELAGLLYTSLRTKIMPLADDVIVYPAHGAGSACGKNMSNATQDTLGHQKTTNYALRADMSKEEFVKEVTTGLVAPPQYFPYNVMMNKTGYASISDVLQQGTQPLSVAAFEAAIAETGAMILDTRNEGDFVNGFIPGSINIGLDGSFAPWAGALITDIKQLIVFVADAGREQEVVTRLARVGYDNCLGYLQGGIAAWQAAGKDLNTVQSITADELADGLEEHPTIMLLDVRKQSEYDAEHIIGAENLPLDNINSEMSKIDRDTTYYVHCAAGYRSVIFISIMMSRGYTKLINVKSGFKALKGCARFNITQYKEPVTML
ncbi:MBL fold metallo-hydrolase [Chitinophagaceae bacterium IBVUCB1]|nr:MBL fold metallo-hydrolase [Chitinophagaceae bacterium IBVUCB1]